MELFHRIYGEGVPIIIMHGLYGASDNWVSVGRILAERFQVFLLDQRNHGRSPHAAEHNYPLMSNDLLEFMEQHKLSKAIIIGHSMGGKTAMHFAIEHPEKIEALVVIDIAPKSYKDLDSFQQQTIDHKKIINAMRSIDFAEINSRSEVDMALSKQLGNERTRQFLLKNLHRNKDNSFEWSLNIEALYSNIDNILNGFNHTTLDKDNENIGFPILFIKGAKSDYILPEDYDSIYNFFPYAEIVTIPNAGHWVHAEQPQLLVKNILYFIDS